MHVISHAPHSVFPKFDHPIHLFSLFIYRENNINIFFLESNKIRIYEIMEGSFWD